MSRVAYQFTGSESFELRTMRQPHLTLQLVGGITSLQVFGRCDVDAPYQVIGVDVFGTIVTTLTAADITQLLGWLSLGCQDYDRMRLDVQGANYSIFSNIMDVRTVERNRGDRPQP